MATKLSDVINSLLSGHEIHFKNGMKLADVDEVTAT